jgi:hypothetical protein
MGKFTEFEKKALEARRSGNQVEVEQRDKAEGKAPVVSLREFAEAPEVPPAAPAPLPPQAEEAPSADENPSAAPAPAVAAPPEDGEAIESLKKSLFGDEKPITPAEETEEEAPVSEPEDLFARKDCPRCGWVIDNHSIHEPTEDDVLEFMESVLGGRRFEKEVSLLNGKITIRFRTVTVEEEDAITSYLNEKMDDKDIQNTSEWTMSYNRARLVCMLKEMRLGEGIKKFPPIKDMACDKETTAKALTRLVDEVPRDWPAAIYGLITQAMLQMDGTYQTLMARAYDPDFWEGRTVE